MGKLLKRLPNSSKEMLNKRIRSLNDSDLGVHDYGHGVYEVYNFDNKQLYNVIYTDKYVECDCVDYHNHCEELGLPCKHILAVKRFVESEPIYVFNELSKLLENFNSRKESLV